MPRHAIPRIAIIGLALLLNFHQIDRVSLWNDEAFSFFAAEAGPAHAIRFIADDTQPPLYYVILSLWLRLGSSVFVIRALSAAAMTIALLPLYATARRLFDERVALLASLLFAIAPICVGWAQRARPYPLQSMLVAFTFWGFVSICLNDSARQRFVGAGLVQAWRRRSWALAAGDTGWITYSVGGAMAMLTQQPAGFFILGCNAGVACIILRNLPANLRLLLNWIIGQLLLLLIWLMWLPEMLHQFAAHLTAEQIASKHSNFLVGSADVLDRLGGLFSITGVWRLLVIFVPLYTALAVFAAAMVIRRGSQAIPLLAPVVVPTLVCVGGFFLVHPIFGYIIGTFAWILVPYVILIAFGILSIRPTVLRWTILGLVLLGNAWGVRNVWQIDTPPLDQVAAVIRARLLPGDGIVLSQSGSGRWGIAYYVGPPYEQNLTGLAVSNWGDAWLIHSIAQALGQPRVWLVLIPGEAPAVDPDVLRQRMKLSFDQRVGVFQVSRFDARASGPGSVD